MAHIQILACVAGETVIGVRSRAFPTAVVADCAVGPRDHHSMSELSHSVSANTAAGNTIASVKVNIAI